MINISFFMFTIIEKGIIKLNIPTNLALDNTQPSDTIGLSNREIVSLYIAGYDQLGKANPESIRWKYRAFVKTLERVHTALDKTKRSNMESLHREFLERCREERYRPWLEELVAAFGWSFACGGWVGGLEGDGACVLVKCELTVISTTVWILSMCHSMCLRRGI